MSMLVHTIKVLLLDLQCGRFHSKFTSYWSNVHSNLGRVLHNSVVSTELSTSGPIVAAAMGQTLMTSSTSICDDQTEDFLWQYKKCLKTKSKSGK